MYYVIWSFVIWRCVFRKTRLFRLKRTLRNMKISISCNARILGGNCVTRNTSRPPRLRLRERLRFQPRNLASLTPWAMAYFEHAPLISLKKRRRIKKNRYLGTVSRVSGGIFSKKWHRLLRAFLGTRYT